MHIPTLIRRITLPVGALLLIAACSSGGSSGWTYAPLGPSANPSAAASGAPSSGAPSSGAPSSGAPGSPSGSGGGSGTAVNIETTNDAPLVFDPADITVPAGATVDVTYLNNSNLPHNIQFFQGADSSAPSLGKSNVATGPNASETVTFTAPTTPGDYFFWCDVHQNAMKGVWHVQ